MKTGLQLTIASGPKPLVKGYRWEGGLLVPNANPGSLSRGTYQVFEAGTAHRVYAVLHSLTSTNGLILNGPVRNIAGGVPTRRGDIVSRAVAETILDETLRAQTITRSGDCYEWSEGPMWAGIDLDKCPEHVRSLPQLQADLKRVLTEFTCGCLMYTSGSCLLRVRGGDFLRGFKAHVVYPVKDGRNIPALSRAIKIRLEATGYVVDTTVNTPEHWWFAGAPVLGPGLVGHEREWLVVEGAEYLEEAELLASVPAEVVALPPRAERVGEPVTLTESERRRYVSGFLAHKLRELEAWGCVVAGSSSRGRHGELNGRVFACGPYEAAGLVDAETLWEMVLRGAESNGYGRKVGVVKMRMEFEKALDEGGLVDLPPLRAEATPDELFGAAPCMPVVESVAAVAEALHAGEVMAQWVGSWLGGDRTWPDWAAYDTPEGLRAFESGALTKSDKADIRREFKKWKKAQGRIKFADAVEGIMSEMNEKYALINDRGGHTMVMWTTDDGNLVFKKVHDFKIMECNRLIKIDDSTVDYGTVWLKHGARRTYDSVVFDPLKECGSNMYNLWKGLLVVPCAGNWPLLKHHIFHVLAGDIPEYYDFIIKYFAWVLQNPGLKAEVVLVIRGASRIGKSLVLDMIRKMFGEHGILVDTPDHLTGQFNSDLEKSCFLFADEVYVSGDTKAQSKLRTIITGDTITIEPKGVDKFRAVNRLSIVMASNAKWTVPIGDGDQRYAVFDALPTYAHNKDYFEALFAEIDNGGNEAFLHDMLTMELGDWHPRWNIPSTEAKRIQAEHSLPYAEAWWLNILLTGDLPGAEQMTPSRTKFEKLREDASGNERRSIQPRSFAKMLEGYGGGLRRTSKGNFWQFLSLAECRALWDAEHGARTWDAATWMSVRGVPTCVAETPDLPPAETILPLTPTGSN